MKTPNWIKLIYYLQSNTPENASQISYDLNLNINTVLTNLRSLENKKFINLRREGRNLTISKTQKLINFPKI